MNYQTHEYFKENSPIVFTTNSNMIEVPFDLILDPILELYKGTLYSNLIKYFITDCISTFGPHIFSIKKSPSRTITNLLSSWIFSLYRNYDYSSDFFFPTNYHQVELLNDTLVDLCKYDPSLQSTNVKINNVLFNLKTNYQHQLDLLDIYKKSKLYSLRRNQYSITKSIIKLTNKYANSETTFYKFLINTPFVNKDKRLNNILNNILIPIRVYDKMNSFYSGPEGKMDDLLWAISYRYQLLGSNNHQLAVLPNIMEQMKQDYNLNFECFASAINNTFPKFCSIYWDLEKYFGSVGSFFNIKPVSGTFGFNPPYQKDIIEIGINRLFEYLDQTTQPLTFIITIPIWDLKGREIMKDIYNNELEKQNIDYGDFPIVQSMQESKYFKQLIMIPKDKFTYIDHNFELYKNKTIQNTYVIILSNANDYDFNKLTSYNFDIPSKINIKKTEKLNHCLV